MSISLREYEITSLLVDGVTNKEIGHKLDFK